MRAPAALIAIPLLAGAAAGLLSESPTMTPRVAAMAALFALVAALASFLDTRPAELTVAIAAGSLLAGLSLGLTTAERACQPPLLAWFAALDASQPVVLEGVLREDAEKTPYGASISVQLPQGGVRLAVVGAVTAAHVDAWRAGRHVRLPALLRWPTEHRNPGAADEVRAMQRRGVALVGTVKSPSLVEITAPGTRLQERAAAMRSAIRGRLHRAVGRWSARSAAISTAILIGDRGQLSEDDERRLQEAGTYHVIAISGGNIAIFAVLVVALLRLAAAPARTAAAAAIVVLLFYGEVAGGAASVGRAITVAVIFLAGRLFDHRGPPLNVLASVAVFGIARSPAAVLDAGFILSFGATAGILLGAGRLVPPVVGRASAGRHAIGAIATLFAASVTAELALAPVTASVFSRVTFAGLVLNFAAIPLMTIVQLTSMVVSAGGLLPDAATIGSGYLAHLAGTGIVESARLVEWAPWLSIDVRPPAAWLIAIYYAAAGGLLHRRVRAYAIAVLAVALALLLTGPDAAARDAVHQRPGTARVVVLDVGQGDATLVSAFDRVLLVDAGGDIGDRVLAPALRALGVRSLDVLALTHGDADHVLGAPAVLHRFDTHQIWEGAPVPPHAGLRALAERARRAVWRNVQAGDVERWGPVEIRVLHPPVPDWERQRVRNEDSIVLEVRLGLVSVVLPGDIGPEAERLVVPRLERGRIVILKAPHHGSAGSSTPAFVDALDPAAVIFSAGRNNRFGHPHPAIVARYEAAGAEIFRTDRDGAVFVETDGATVEVWGWAGRRVAFRRPRAGDGG
jgi:competence protein ComEC